MALPGITGPQMAAWSVILGLALLLIGGLVLWAYGRRHPRTAVPATGPEAEATRHFHAHLVRWFFIYGILVMLAGSGLLFWATSVFY
jgi:LPXTG-motif cell wall-anchored protein